MDAPKRIFAWSAYPTSHLVGTWGVTRYPNNAEHYILAAEHDRLMAEKDAEIARIKALWQQRGKFHHQDGCCCRFEDDGETQTAWCANHAMMRDEIAWLRHQIHEVSEPDFLFGAMDNVHDMGVTLADFADAASRAIRAALENRDADT